ncbi:hypothetical protein [Leucobacter chromiireducens]|uniref:hypothetical protein n=1 Tax=Leucobacter chromiireducens TaxID=283877 RepID=UPI001926B3AD|nr:hypothetical protein [Leucobacter chromiireducens]
MRVSEFYGLAVSQPSLDFLDVDTILDTPVFVDPSALRGMKSEWAQECVSLLQDFYDEVLASIRSGDRNRGIYLLSMLGESNEAHLGLSRAASSGSGVAAGLAADIYDALSSSGAVTSGLLNDIEETALFVPGIGHDRISDMTINIIRSQLIKFTQRMCLEHGIPLEPGLDSGPQWNRHTHRWEAEHVSLPMPNSKLLLIPKGIVRKTSIFDAGDYLTHYVLPYLQEKELRKTHSPLVKQRSKRRGFARYVTKKSLREQNRKPTKPWNEEVTEERPKLLSQYRGDKAGLTEPPGHDDIAAITGTPPPDWSSLLEAVLIIPPGTKHADDYHRAIQNLLTALLYPALDMPIREFQIHEGRKRVDLVYTNVAETGFFHWITTKGNVEAPNVFVECKNYSNNLANPEFDQLSGRFSPRKGRLGLLCYRGFGDNRSRVIARCKDTALDNRGIIIALDDDDLKLLVQARIDGHMTLFEHLKQRYMEII